MILRILLISLLLPDNQDTTIALDEVMTVFFKSWDSNQA